MALLAVVVLVVLVLGVIGFAITLWKKQSDEASGLRLSLMDARNQLGVERELRRKEQTEGENRMKTQEAYLKAVMEATVAGALEKFKSASGEQLKSNGAEFAAFSRKSMAEILDPLKQRIKEYDERADKIHRGNTVLGTELKGYVQTIRESAQKIQSETVGFRNDLKFNNKFQGDFGEDRLELVLERCGFAKGDDYVLQSGEEGKIPDCRLYDPLAKKILVIDSKMSWKSYSEAFASSDPAARNAALDEHVKSVRSQIDNLAKKKYPETLKPDRAGYSYVPFAVMFVPSDGALMAAIERDASLLQHAAEQKVYLTSPLNLYNLLKLIKTCLGDFDFAENLTEIAKEARSVIERIDSMFSEFEDLGDKLAKATAAYGTVRKRLTESSSDNRSSILESATKMIRLGVRHDKLKSETIEQAVSAVCLGIAFALGAGACYAQGEMRPATRPQTVFSRAGYWPVEGSPRRVTSMNAGWKFSLDSFKTSKAVNLPHAIDEGEIGFAASGGVNRQQPAWYRKTFAWRGSSARQFLHFEAIMGKSRVKLNGREIAAHFGGFLPIHAEVTGILRDGENLLEVWCDNSDDPTYPPGKPQNQLDFAYFGGIYRDAWLVETGAAYVTDSDRGGVYVRARLEENGRWTVRADATLGGETDGATTHFLYDGVPVTPPFEPAHPKLWSPETPNLHLLTVEVVKGGRVIDSVGVRFGIRDFKLDERGLTLNGKPYPKKLIGANRHQDYLFIGNALPNSLHWRDVKKYRDCGMTVFRNAHYPQDPAFMDACDELGMFVIVNTPGWQFWNRKNPVFESRVYDDIVKMVRRDRSRPSLLLWEPILNETRFPASFVTNAVRLVKRETEAPNYCACDAISSGSDICDVNYGAVKKLPDGRDKPAFCREWGDFPDDWNAQNSSSRVPMEWGESAMVAQAWHYMEETYWPSLATQQAQPAAHFGGTLWHGADHARGYHPDNFFGGILTYGRQKKYSWHAFKAALTDRPYVFVAHELAPYSPAEIPVYSNCAYTATWLGKPFVPGETKFRYCDEHRLTYDWKHPDRVQKAVLKIRLPDGTEVVRERALRFARIDLNLDTEGLAPVADGSDLVALTATLADRNGTPKRYAREKVRFTVEGPAEIVGENPQETRWGEAIVLIRPKAAAVPQPITVRAFLVRRGEYARQNGYLTFTPGSAEVTRGHLEGADTDRVLREVERQQLDFNVRKGE